MPTPASANAWEMRVVFTITELLSPGEVFVLIGVPWVVILEVDFRTDVGYVNCWKVQLLIIVAAKWM